MPPSIYLSLLPAPPLTPAQRAAAARWRLSPRARRPPAPGASRWQSCWASSGGRRTTPQAAAREGPARRPAFLPDGSFRARACSLSLLARTLARSFSFFPSLRSPARGAFSARTARALLPAGPGRAGRPAALPAPLHPRSGGGGGGGAPRSDSFQYGTDARRMRPRPPTTPQLRGPPGNRRPSPLARGTPDLASPRPPTRGAGAARETTRPWARVHYPPLFSGPLSAPRRRHPRGRGAGRRGVGL